MDVKLRLDKYIVYPRQTINLGGVLEVEVWTEVIRRKKKAQEPNKYFKVHFINCVRIKVSLLGHLLSVKAV